MWRACPLPPTTAPCPLTLAARDAVRRDVDPLSLPASSGNGNQVNNPDKQPCRTANSGQRTANSQQPAAYQVLYSGSGHLVANGEAGHRPRDPPPTWTSAV
ncbi:hypothetical protein COCCADRAFT_101671 [Bipolaris zeicola 26-R-13]|uniref:Uncharacterized protein n=1 Tax=Cochliobolus carbonum (strain 26-R-13) TaxID=930089 RepID=W6Y7L7_COCC2|nr:uncharacterized protein COCCADRAFT_101671 [Bipolaris zeicola 26-R-13]EUC31289.1 hypothetical protein COCCADRAFT_101671 [Bipolaris zeicola 26-R-13]